MSQTGNATVRVFGCSVPDSHEGLLEQIKEANAENNTSRRGELCKQFVLDKFKERVRHAFPHHKELTEEWLENASRDTDALGSVVLVIDEITKCPELAPGIVAQQEDIYSGLGEYCERAQLILAGTSAARILESGQSAAFSSDPEKVHLVEVGPVQEGTGNDSYLQQLLNQVMPGGKVSLADLQRVKFLAPYLSNARTAMLLVDEVKRHVEPSAAINREDAYRIWKRFPWIPGCFVPLRYRSLNGLSRLTTPEQRELVARNALAMLMHLAVAGLGCRPTAADAMDCIDLGLCMPSSYSKFLEIYERDPHSKNYSLQVTFASSPALKQMLLAAFDVPKIIPQDGDSFEDLIAEAERRSAEVVTGRRAILIHLDRPLPPPQNQKKMEGIPQDQFLEILSALAGNETVVLKNGPSAQGADILVLRRGKRPLVRLIQAKNTKAANEILPVVATLGATCRNETKKLDAKDRSQLVLEYFCRLVHEGVTPQDQDLQRRYGLLCQSRQKVFRMNVKVQMILWESARPRNLSRNFQVIRPRFLLKQINVQLRSLQHLAPFPTDVKAQRANASYMTCTFKQ